jgi:hypothetical protein
VRNWQIGETQEAACQFIFAKLNDPAMQRDGTLRYIEGSAPRPVAPPSQRGSNGARTLRFKNCQSAFKNCMPNNTRTSRIGSKDHSTVGEMMRFRKAVPGGGLQ